MSTTATATTATATATPIAVTKSATFRESGSIYLVNERLVITYGGHDYRVRELVRQRDGLVNAWLIRQTSTDRDFKRGGVLVVVAEALGDAVLRRVNATFAPVAPAPILGAGDVEVTRDRLDRPVLVIPDAAVTTMRTAVWGLHWSEIDAANVARSSYAKPGTPVHAAAVVLLTAAGVADGDGFHGFVVGRSGWDTANRWWTADRDRLSLPGSMYVDDALGGAYWLA